MAGGPPSPALYIEWERVRGTRDDVHRRLNPLPHPDPISGCAWPTGSATSASSSTTTTISAAGSASPRPRLLRRQPPRNTPPMVYAFFPSPLSLSLSCSRSKMNHLFHYSEPCTPYSICMPRLILVQKYREEKNLTVVLLGKKSFNAPCYRYTTRQTKQKFKHCTCRSRLEAWKCRECFFTGEFRASGRCGLYGTISMGMVPNRPKLVA